MHFRGPEHMNTFRRDETVASGPKGYPLVGHLPDFLRDKLGFLSRCAAQYGDVVKLEIGEPTFLLNNPSDIQHVLVTNPDKYEKTPRMIRGKARQLSGEGLLTTSGAAHLRQRRMLQPVFYRKTIESFAKIITETTSQLLVHWKPGTTINVTREMTGLAQQIIVRSVFGEDFTDEGGQLAEAITIRRRYLEQVFFSLIPFPEHVPTRIQRNYPKAMELIDQTIYRAINMRRVDDKYGDDLLSLLLKARYEDGMGMTDKQIHEEALILLVTGYETIGEALSWTAYLLAQHPDISSRLLVEVDAVLDDRVPQSEDLPKLEYAGMVLAESMRLYPPTWIFVRMARNEDKLPSGVTIPAGSKLYLCQYVVHRNPLYFPDPERFDPERFSEPGKKTRPKFSYFPFGGGPRACIGEAFAKMEGVLVLAMVAQRFTLQLVPGQMIIPEPKMTLRPKNGILMRIEDRQLVYGRAR
jgi:cytochrome P450